MNHFHRKKGVLHCEEVALPDIARQVGTPCYVYSCATLDRHAAAIKQAFSSFPTSFCFAVKANSNIHILNRLAQHGYGGDIVSVGELERCLLAGMSPERIVFSGVGKQEHELKRALECGIKSFNVESAFELEALSRLSKELDKTARIALRINPNIDAKTNPKISTGLHSTKFGMSLSAARSLAVEVIKDAPRLQLVGLACHIGSQITDISPLGQAAEYMAGVAKEFTELGFQLEFVNMGGGLGIRYEDEIPPTLEQYAQALTKPFQGSGLGLVIEPGRVLIGNVGVMLTRVIGSKKTGDKHFVIADAAMNDLPRPAVYGSHHGIEVVAENPGQAARTVQTCDVVGPICETGDFLGKERQLPALEAGELLCIRSVGAYSSSMASNYNSRLRAPEVLVGGQDGQDVQVIRARERLEDLWRLEVDHLKDSAEERDS